MATLSVVSETYTPDNLLAGHADVITDVVTIASSAALTRGAVLGKITSGGKYQLSASAAGDGSETPVAILAEDADASGGDVTNVPVYIAGEFNQDAVTLGTGHTVASVKDALAQKGVFLKDPVPADTSA